MRRSFLELPFASCSSALVIVDVDGTLVPDSAMVLTDAAKAALKELSSHADVRLCSNALPERTAAFAKEAGVGNLSTRHKKPSRRVVESIEKFPERVIVIGDKALTDGLFAANIGAEFFMVRRLRGEGESLKGRIGYAADSLIAPFLGLLRKAMPYLMLMRPTQWVKNLLVFTPLFFAGAAFSVPLIGESVLAFMSFSLAASAMYILNDYRDREADALHPTKRFRPLASGAVSGSRALILMSVLGLTSIGLAFFMGSLLIVLLSYGALNTAYSFFLKRVPVVDVASVSGSYILRVLAGGAATGIYVSPWLVSCVFFGALILITGKRRAEFVRASRRAVLKRYSMRLLDYLLISAAALAIISYALYAIFAEHHLLIGFSAILVSLAIIRLVRLVLTSPDAEYPEVLAFKDPAIALFALSWVALMFTVLYL